MFDFFDKVRKNVKAYQQFLEDNNVQDIQKWSDIPLCDKENYLLKYPMKELAQEDISNAFLIGTSSGFSKSGSVFWLKEAVDERAYLEIIKQIFIKEYSIDRQKTLFIISLAFGTWIGGMQIATTLRAMASDMEHVTLATPGLDLKEAAEIAQKFGAFYDQILWICNPSSINIIYALVKDDDSLLQGKISFPVVGEYFSEDFREDIAFKFGHDRKYIYSIKTGYGSADAGDLGIESEETVKLRKFFNNHSELLQKLFKTNEAPMMFVRNEKAFIESIEGELIVTKDQFIPLVRYNTKDRGGILKKRDIKEYIDSVLYATLPDEILYVFGRVSDSIIFYGTNLNIHEIDKFLSSLKEMSYGGLFDVKEIQKDGVSLFEFTIYTEDIKEELALEYQNTLIEFLKKSSNEFSAKYDKLSKAVDKDLITVNLKFINELQIDKKHRYIK